MARPALSAARAIDVVNFLAAHPTETFSLTDLVERLGINVSSLHAVLAVLTERGYVRRHPRHRTYALGPALVAIGAVALEQQPVIEAAREEARRLGDRLGLDVGITALAGRDLAFVARTAVRHARAMSLYVGQRLQLRAPIGSIYYAWSDPATIAEWLDDVPEEERAADRTVLDVIAARGFSVTVVAEASTEGARRTEHLLAIDPHATYDVSSIAGPVFDPDGAVALTINFIGFPGGMTGAESLALGAQARDSGLLVTKRTRGRVPAILAEGDGASP